MIPYQALPLVSLTPHSKCSAIRMNTSAGRELLGSCRDRETWRLRHLFVLPHQILGVGTLGLSHRTLVVPFPASPSPGVNSVESASSTAHPMFGVYGLSLHPRPGPRFPGLVTRAHLGIIAKSSWAIHVYFLFSEPLL